MGNGGSFTTVRAFYHKVGRIKYISHLDMNRCIGRTLKRTGLPVWHTLGFNPHIYLTFALPLSLGYESLCESFDFRLVEDVPFEEVATRLNTALPEGLSVTQVALPLQKPEAISTATYQVSLEYDHLQGFEVLERLEDWYMQEQLLVEKRTKKGIVQVDVKPYLTILQAHAAGHLLTLELQCAAGGSFNLNPMLPLDTFAKARDCPSDWQRVLRTAILDMQGIPFA